MNITKRSPFLYVLIFLFVTVFIACEKDFNNLAVEGVTNQNFVTDTLFIDVSTFNRQLQAIRTDVLPVYKLGKISDPIYNSSNTSIAAQLSLPTSFTSTITRRFGELTQEQEEENLAFFNSLTPQQQMDTVIVTDERERITEVYLEIPYFSNAKGDADNDGAPDEIEENAGLSDPSVADPDSDGDGVIDPLDDVSPFGDDFDGDGVPNGEEEAGESPYLADSDGDGILDGVDDINNVSRVPQKYTLDSVFGNRNANVTFRVNKLETYLRDLDPNSDFQTAQEYFSTFQPLEGTNYFNDLLPDPAISDFDIVTVTTEDDMMTEEDETVVERLTPRLRVKLNVDAVSAGNIFTSTNDFQNDIINLEGGDELFNNNNFREHFRGITFGFDTPEDILVYFNITQARVVIKYEYDNAEINDNNTPDDDTDDFLEPVTKDGEAIFPLSGKVVNLYNNDAYTGLNLQEGTSAQRLYLRGGEGIFTEIQLFDPIDSNPLSLQSIRDSLATNNWVINEARLIAYVDQDEIATFLTGTQTFDEANRIYLYNLQTGGPLFDYFTDTSFGGSDGDIKSVYGGVLERDDNELGVKYQIRLTDHVKNIVDNDSTNVHLGLAITSSINEARSASAMSGPDMSTTTQERLAIGSIISRKGTILFGGTEVPGQEDKKMQLRIIYTDPNKQDN
ncbi:DUF4270 family protein [Sungkyunkwania multivorans]|uniref:DUF4270 family protein n=1 Tax=Sungkyunkwania multivorans TaxID=1173618 RepID=A0ABW3D2I8_9FLAO